MKLNQGNPNLNRVLAVSILALVSNYGLAQGTSTPNPTNPVYLADAPVALETIERAMVLSTQGSYTEAARTLSQLIIEQGDRLTPETPNGEISIPVRRRIESVLLSDPQLLEAYRRIYSPKAQRLIDDGHPNEAWRNYWLTPAGCQTALNHAQLLIESARFASGLRVLEELLDHPDAPKYAVRSTGIARIAARAKPENRSRTLYEKWSAISGVAASNTPPFDHPADSQTQITSLRSAPMNPEAAGLRLDGIVPRPIATAKLSPPPSTDELASVDDQPRSGAVSQPKPWAMPVVWGDSLITNDGVTISCFDRFTLRPKWRVTTTATETEEQDRTSIGIRARIARTVEDLSSATIQDDVVYVAAGLARTGKRTGDNRLLALDLHNGSILHSTTLEKLDPSLEESTIRGSVIVDGDTLIVAARKNLRRERLVALALVGIDRHTFKHLWTRQIGSAGSLPFQQIGQISHSGVLDEGVLYWTDMMGLVCSVETATGDILWAKGMPTSDIYARYEREPWTVSTPVVRGEHVYILGVDGQRIDQLNKHTGETIGWARSTVSGQGLYLIETPTQIACVNQTGITMHSIERFGVLKPHLITPTGDGRSAIRGRVIGSGSTLIVPISSGLVMLDTNRVGVRTSIDLEQTGIAVALDGQILITDENEVSSYLSWDIARQLLTNRIDILGDVHAAITLGDLAFRSDHHDQILPAIDRAVDILRGPMIGSNTRDEARGRLFSVILDMVGLPDDQNLSSGGTLDQQIRSGLLGRSAMVARSPEQTLAQQMTRGAWHRALGEMPQAVRIYHGILQDQSLSSGMWQGGGLAIRAEIEATRQLEDIVAEHGREICAMFDDLAAADRDAMMRSGSADEYEQLARNYPWAITTPSVWAMAADQWLNDDNAPAAVRAAQSGVDSVHRLGVHGIHTELPTLNKLGSALVGGLLDSQRQSEAARAASRLSSVYPSILFTIHGQRIDAGTLSVGLSSGQPAPVLGSRFVYSDQPTLLTGSPVKSPIRTEFDTMVFFAPQLAQARMVRFANSVPEILWTRRAPDVEPPVVVVHNEFQTILMWAPPSGDPLGGSIESVETFSGETRWKIDAMADLLLEHTVREPDDVVQIDGQFVSPTEGVVRPEQVLSVCDGSVLVLVDRIGRGMGIDILTGRVLWKGDLPINRVHDVDLSSGVLGIAGMWFVDHNAQTGEALERAPRIASIDARTGQTIQLLHAQTSTPRWVRVAPSGSLLVGTSQRILSVSSRTGTFDWVIRNTSLFNTNAGWIIDETLVVLDEFVGLWSIKLANGQIRDNAFTMSGRVVERGWVDVRAQKENLAVAASGGFGVFDDAGHIVGLDSEQARWPYVDSAWASDRVVLVRRAAGSNDEFTHVPVKMFDQRNARLSDSVDLTLPNTIQRQPTNVQAANGVVVIGFGEVSVLLETE